MITRRTTLISGAAALAAPAILRRAWAAATPGVTANEIKIGNTMPYSGPASAYSSVGKADAGFFKWVNDQGGVAGHKINFISYDDGYSPPKTVEQVRRLVEQDQVAFLFHTLGTPTNSAIERDLQPEKSAAAVCRNGRGQVGELQGVSVDHRMAAELPHGSPDLHQIPAQGESEGEASDSLSER